MHNLLHDLLCPHCWQALAAAGVASFAVFGIGARVLWGRLRAKLEKFAWHR